MKKTLLLIVIMELFSYRQALPQEIKTLCIDSSLLEIEDSIVSIRKQISNLESLIAISDSVSKGMFIYLAQSINSTTKVIDDTRLRESIKSAESTINNQNSFIQIFGIIFGLIALGAALIYFFSLRPIFNQAERALDKTNEATDKLEGKISSFTEDIDKNIKDQFIIFEKNLNDRTLNELFKDIGSKLQNQRKIQIEKLTTLDNATFTSERIDRLFKVLDSNIISEYEKAIIIEVLLQVDNYQIQKYFEVWKNVKSEEVSVINLLYSYYIKKGIDNYHGPIINYILKKLEPHIEVNRLLDMLPSHPTNMIALLNCHELVSSISEHSRKSII